MCVVCVCASLAFQSLYGFLSVCGNVKTVELVSKKTVNPANAPIHIVGPGVVAIHSHHPPDSRYMPSSPSRSYYNADQVGLGGCGCFGKSKKYVCKVCVHICCMRACFYISQGVLSVECLALLSGFFISFCASMCVCVCVLGDEI